MELRRPWGLDARWRAWFDRIVVLAVAAVCLYVLRLGWSNEQWGPVPLVAVLMAAQVLPLWWRRRFPVEVLAIVAGFHVVQVLVSVDPLPSQLAFPIAVYSAARWGGPWVRAASVPLTLAASAVAGWRWSGPGELSAMVSPAVICATVTMAAWAFGIAGTQRDRYLGGLVERAEYLERATERDVALAAQDERARIAREMHDVVAHGLSVMVVQADGGRYAGQRDPHLALAALETIAATGRDSLQEMRRLLGLLRTGDSGVVPQPTLSDVPHLIAEARAAGDEVAAEISEDLPAVSDGIGLAAYRFVQEAMTNVRKHAGPQARSRVRIHASPSVLVLEVSDDGRGAAAPGGSGGLGLLGMRERIAVHGGEVSAGPRPGGGWAVSAKIPL